MFTTFKKEMIWGGKKLSIETGKIARQADGAVIVSYGETVVHAAVCASKNTPDTFEDFIPLTVNYIEKAYAAGKIPGGFFKREGKPSEAEVLTSRLIDRPIRPLFVKGFNNDTQVTCTLLSHDLENAPDIVAMIAASAALTISGLPFLGPIAGARV
ncbi:MAG: polyribonucleotide nucleotidyltransferase, partial [Alphaproteobacteria bacterium]|nr:polyribonucleotide nucleotidyltransferase [Alphaproteobacteria bacterium]